jgi:hypothetical protein
MPNRRSTSRPERIGPVREAEQLAALSRLHQLFVRSGIDHWLFGGWAVDFHAGSVTRPHDDLDLAVWKKDKDRIERLLTADGWRHRPDEGGQGYAVFVHDAVRLEVAFVDEGRVGWPPGSFEDEVRQLGGMRVPVVSLHALKADKAEVRDDPRVAAKDRVDSSILSRLTDP